MRARRFDALGLVHKLDIDGAAGTVTYLSRKLNRGTEAYIAEHGAMPPNGGTFAEPPATGLVGRALAGMTGCLFVSNEHVFDDASIHGDCSCLSAFQVCLDYACPSQPLA